MSIASFLVLYAVVWSFACSSCCRCKSAPSSNPAMIGPSHCSFRYAAFEVSAVRDPRQRNCRGTGVNRRIGTFREPERWHGM